MLEEADLGEDESDSDEEMSEAPCSAAPAQAKQRLERAVDEEGFELVQKRGSRKSNHK